MCTALVNVNQTPLYSINESENQQNIKMTCTYLLLTFQVIQLKRDIQSCPLRQVQTSKVCERTNNQVKACCFITNNAGGNMSTHLNMKIGTPRMLIGNFDRHSSFLVLLTQMTLRLISTRHYDWSSPHRIKLYPRQDVWRLIQR